MRRKELRPWRFSSKHNDDAIYKQYDKGNDVCVGDGDHAFGASRAPAVRRHYDIFLRTYDAVISRPLSWFMRQGGKAAPNCLCDMICRDEAGMMRRTARIFLAIIGVDDDDRGVLA